MQHSVVYNGKGEKVEEDTDGYVNGETTEGIIWSTRNSSTGSLFVLVVEDARGESDEDKDVMILEAG